MKFQFKESLKQELKKKMSMVAALSMLFAVGCGNYNPAGSGNNAAGDIGVSGNTEAGKLKQSLLRLDLGITSAKASVSESRFIESNNGNIFNSIAEVNLSIEPGEYADLQELQPYGIFAVYLAGDACFTLKTSDGLDLTVKSIMLEKCSFIDLKIFNSSQHAIKVSGIIAGE